MLLTIVAFFAEWLALAHAADNPQCALRGSHDFLEWIRAEGGFLDPRVKLSFGPANSSDLRGMFLTAPVQKDELLASIPKKLIISGEEKDGILLECSRIAALRAELQLGECSFFWPYLKSISEHEVMIPDAWTPKERGMLNGLPGNMQFWNTYSEKYTNDCGGDTSDSIGMRALWLFVSRASKLGMMPLYDSFNSHSERNVQEFISKTGDVIAMMAIKNLEAGAELFVNYMDGKGQGAPEVFRDYGYIEQPPTKWWVEYKSLRYWFTLMDEDGHVVFPSSYGVKRLKNLATIARSKLRKTQQILDAERENESSQQKLLFTYVGAFHKALEAAIVAVEQTDSEL